MQRICTETKKGTKKEKHIKNTHKSLACGQFKEKYIDRMAATDEGAARKN